MRLSGNAGENHTHLLGLEEKNRRALVFHI